MKLGYLSALVFCLGSVAATASTLSCSDAAADLKYAESHYEGGAAPPHGPRLAECPAGVCSCRSTTHPVIS